MAPRVLGRNVQLLVFSEQLQLPIALGEMDKFKATSGTDIVKRRPMGYTIEAATERYSGYDLSITFGKTGPMVERWNHLVERGIFAGNKQPELFIFEAIKHYDHVAGIPIIENWIYKGVTLFGLDKETGIDEIAQDMRGFSTHKELGPADTTFVNLKWLPGIGFQEVVHRSAQTDFSSKNVINNAINGALDFLRN